MLKKHALQEAAKAFDSRRYPLDFYRHHLAILKGAKAVNTKVNTSVRELFSWRMGKVRVGKIKFSDTAKPTSFVDSGGNTNYAAGVTEITERAIEKATSNDLLKRGIAFRNGDLSFGEFAGNARKIVQTSIYLPCFFVHIWKPDEHPLFEKKVWALCRSEKGNSFTFFGTPNSMNRYRDYMDWFNDLIEKMKIDRWTAQLGLWELGRRFEREAKRDFSE